MKAGVIAAGLGTRLAQGGVLVPKPLVRVGGETLIGRALGEAAAAGASRAAVITTPAFPEVARVLEAGPWPLPVDLLVWDSPSSIESFLALEPYLDEPFLMLTVDGVFAPGALSRFAAQAQAAPAAGVLGLTRFQEDEKPRYVEVDPAGRVTRVGGAAPAALITAGCYFFHPEVFALKTQARTRGLGALREFLAFLVEAGFPLWGLEVGPAIDVDHPHDIARAEAFLREGALACPG